MTSKLEASALLSLLSPKSKETPSRRLSLTESRMLDLLSATGGDFYPRDYKTEDQAMSNLVQRAADEPTEELQDLDHMRIACIAYLASPPAWCTRPARSRPRRRSTRRVRHAWYHVRL